MGVDFLVFGATGYFGSHVIKHLQRQNRSYAVATARIENRADVLRDIQHYQPRFVINAAGLAGTPNIDWFETHQQEGIRVNLIGALNVVDACYVSGPIHCTTFGTGFMYTYDTDHPQNSGIGFKETDPPNFTGPFYVKLRIQLEELLKAYPNVLNLRIDLPISDDCHPRSLIGKLVTFNKIFSIPNSVTVIDDLWPLIPKLAERGVVGTLNFVNPGTITNERILQLYKQYVDPSKTWTVASPEEHDEMKKRRPNHELDVSKLLELFPDIDPIEQSIEKLMIRISQSRTTN